MGLFDRFTGTKHPPEGVTPLPAAGLTSALLALSTPETPYAVRRAPGGTLVAEWRLAEPTWRPLFLASQLTHEIRITMRLVPDTHEVRALEEHWEVTRVGNPPRFTKTKQYTRGPARTISHYRTLGGGEGPGETFHFDSADLKNPVQSTVLDAGWTWRGVLLGKP